MVRQKHGKGMFRFGAAGNKIYNGDWRQDKFHGEGELSTPHSFYKGPFDAHQMRGTGFTYLANGTVSE